MYYKLMLATESAHARTLVTEAQFCTYVKLCLRFLIDPELKKKQAHLLLDQLTNYMWRHLHFNEELPEEVHIIDFLNSIGIPKNSLPHNHDKYGDHHRELIHRLCIVSLELVHRIPLCRHRKHGNINYSWVRNLCGVDQGKIMPIYICSRILLTKIHALIELVEHTMR